MKLSIVIVNWNSRDLLRDCLVSLRAHCGHLAPQVVVVDGGSFDGCGEMLEAGFPEVEFVQSPHNIGFGRCNNLGFSRATGDLVLLLNPDTVVHEGAVDALIDAMQAAPDAGMVGAHLLNTDGSLQLFGVHPLPTPWNCAFDSDWGRRRWWLHHGPPDSGPPVAVEAVSGACILMRASIFREVGGFSPQYFMYGEDMDLAMKVTRRGLKVYYAPDARITHYGGGSSRNEFNRFPVIMIREAHWVFMLLNHGYPTAVLYRTLMGVSAVMRCLLLAGVMMMKPGNARVAARVALCKWWSVLRWCLGLEAWASAKFRESGRPVSFGAGDCGLEKDFSGNCV